VHPLGLAIARIAPVAALEDPRFPPLEPPELAVTRLEVSVLTVAEPIVARDREGRRAAVEVGRHGLILESPGGSGLLLPQVAVEQGWDRDRFLEGICEKAGVGPDRWADPSSRLFRFEAAVAAETAPGVPGPARSSPPPARGAR
jgi:AmmeMemoRadiSam system protein A